MLGLAERREFSKQWITESGYLHLAFGPAGEKWFLLCWICMAMVNGKMIRNVTKQTMLEIRQCFDRALLRKKASLVQLLRLYWVWRIFFSLNSSWHNVYLLLFKLKLKYINKKLFQKNIQVLRSLLCAPCATSAFVLTFGAEMPDSLKVC